MESGSFFDEHLTVRGTISAKEDVRVQGRVEGSMVSEKDIIVEDSGDIEANLTGSKVVIKGRVQGTVECKSLFVLHESGIMDGLVRSRRIQIDEGSTFQGSIDMVN